MKTNVILIKMQDGTKVVRHEKESIMELHEKYPIGKKINYCTPKGAIKNGPIESTTITSKWNRVEVRKEAIDG